MLSTVLNTTQLSAAVAVFCLLSSRKTKFLEPPPFLSINWKCSNCLSVSIIVGREDDPKRQRKSRIGWLAVRLVCGPLDKSDRD